MKSIYKLINNNLKILYDRYFIVIDGYNNYLLQIIIHKCNL